MSEVASVVDVTCVVVSYNTREITLACLRSFVEELGGLSADLVVVDNDSNDGSVEAIEALFDSMSAPGLTVKFIASEENLGFGAACNLGAMDARGRYVLMLNPDTVVLDRGVEKLVAFARSHPEARMWGGRTLHLDRTLNPASAWAKPTIWSSLCCALGLASKFEKSALLNLSLIHI